MESSHHKCTFAKTPFEAEIFEMLFLCGHLETELSKNDNIYEDTSYPVTTFITLF